MTTRREPNHPVMLNLGLMKIRLVSASGPLFSAFGRRIFHPRPQDGVFRCALNKIVLIKREVHPFDNLFVNFILPLTTEFVKNSFARALKKFFAL
jgi:hypothetical protein